MSPFGQVLHELRQKSGLRQVELAERMGYEQSYLSALELGVKGPSPTEFIQRLVSTLELDQETEEKVFRAAANSNRKFTIPVDVPLALYETCNEFHRNLGQLHPVQVEMIQQVLRMPERLKTGAGAGTPRIKRRVHKKEN